MFGKIYKVHTHNPLLYRQAQALEWDSEDAPPNSGILVKVDETLDDFGRRTPEDLQAIVAICALAARGYFDWIDVIYIGSEDVLNDTTVPIRGI